MISTKNHPPKTPLISVIIPVHNREQWIGDCIQSVLNQSRPADEILVIDDGSDDDTAKVIKSYGDQVTHVCQATRGVSSARNRGIRQARGDWIAFLDSDDRWHPDKLEAQLRHLDRHPDCRLIHADEIWIRHGRRVNQKKVHRKSGGMIYEMCLPRCVISPSAVMIHHTVFDDFGLFDETLPACEDYDLWLRICRSEPVCYVDRPLITKYGGHEDQLSRSFEAMDRFRVRVLLNHLEREPLRRNQLHPLLKVLIKKAAILQSGAWKRGNYAACGYYKHAKNKGEQLMQRLK